MKILFTCDTMGCGGAERVISILANRMSENNEVSIIMVSHHLNESFYELNSSICLVPLLSKFHGNETIFSRIKKLRTIIEEKKPDIVISFLPHVCVYTFFALRNLNIPLIVSERNDPNQMKFIEKKLVRLVFKKSNGCVFQTNDAKNWYGKKVRSKSVIIQNPVKLSFIPKNPVNIRAKTVVAVGRFFEQKNYKFLIESFLAFSQNHSDFCFKIFGDGPLKNKMKKIVNDYSLEKKVIFCSNNKFWHKEAYNSSIFVLGSKFEGMPNSLEEALCLGIPCVSTDCPIGGPKDLKKLFPNNLFLAKLNDKKDFVKKMESALLSKKTFGFIPLCLTDEFIYKEWLDFIKQIFDKFMAKNNKVNVYEKSK